MMKALEVARNTLQMYADVDAESVKMLAGFDATPDMRDPNSPAEKTLKAIKEILGEK
jgi:hypothetical protein